MVEEVTDSANGDISGDSAEEFGTGHSDGGTSIRATRTTTASFIRATGTTTASFIRATGTTTASFIGAICTTTASNRDGDKF